MIKRIIFIALLCCSFACQAERLIIEPEMGRAPILNAFKNSHKDIKLIIYGFTDRTLLQSLIDQKKIGKSVEVIIEKAPYKAAKQNVRAIKALGKTNIPLKFTAKHHNYTHQKTLLIDDKEAVVMTFNFTRSAFDKQRNFAITVDDPMAVFEIKQHFDADWKKRKHAASNTVKNLIWSPETSRTKLLGLINSAHRHIDIYAASLQDKEIIEALNKQAIHGIKIKILTSKKIKKKSRQKLSHRNIQIRRSKKLFIHAKAMIIDDKVAEIGSINFTQNSIDRNRELAVITSFKPTVTRLHEVFADDWRMARLNEVAT